MWIVLSEPFDPTGPWLANGLAGLLSEDVWHLTSRDLAAAVQTDRAMYEDGMWFRVVLADGRRIESRQLQGVVNRICSPAVSLVPSLAARRIGAAPEIGTPLMRWLFKWQGPVLNRPNVDGLSGDYRPAFWWMDHAIRSGFVSTPTIGAEAPPGAGQPAPVSDEARAVWVVVIGRQVISLDDPGRIVAASLTTRCLRLAQAAGAAILGVEAVPGPMGEWRFVSASLRPDLVRGGDTVLRATVMALGVAPRRERDVPTAGFQRLPISDHEPR